MNNETLNYEILKFIEFQDLTNWSVKYAEKTIFDFNQDFKLVKIGDFLLRSKDTIEIQDKQMYKRVTIRINNGGILLRDKVIGAEIGTKNQFLVKEGQFLLSKIDARNGAFGVVPHECDKAVITGNFWTFDVNMKLINPYFLSMLTTTKQFLKFCQKSSNGTTNRHYLQEELFLTQQVPLPSLEKQAELIAKFIELKDIIKKAEQEIINAKIEFENSIFN